MVNWLRFIWIVVAVNSIRAKKNTSEDLVVKLLDSGYQKDVRPRCGVNNNDTVQVEMDLALRQIIELDEPQQILHTNCWLRITWADCRLVWNSSNYRDINSIVVPAKKLWYPDLTLYDSAEVSNQNIQNYRIGLSSNGSIRQYLPAVLVSLCSIDVSIFPFDEQECNLTFGMWTHNGLDVDIVPKRNADLSRYVQHVEWRLISFNSERIVNVFEDIPYPVVIYQLKLQRKPLFYVINLLFPCVLISTIALLGFILPSESGEKVNLEVTVLLSLAVFQLIVLDTMPPSSETLPVIGLYFAATMVMVALSLVMTVLVLNIHFRGKTECRAPRVLRYIIINGLGKVFCIQTMNPMTNSTVTKRYNTEEDGLANCNGGASIFQIDIPSRKPNKRNTEQYSNHYPLRMELSSVTFSELVKINEKMLSSMEYIGNKLCDSSDKIRNTDEWFLMAIILDRFFFLIFLVISVSLVFAFMLRYI